MGEVSTEPCFELSVRLCIHVAEVRTVSFSHRRFLRVEKETSDTASQTVGYGTDQILDRLREEIPSAAKKCVQRPGRWILGYVVPGAGIGRIRRIDIEKLVQATEDLFWALAQGPVKDDVHLIPIEDLRIPTQVDDVLALLNHVAPEGAALITDCLTERLVRVGFPCIYVKVVLRKRAVDRIPKDADQSNIWKMGVDATRGFLVL
jgi:hypothetical protein